MYATLIRTYWFLRDIDRWFIAWCKRCASKKRLAKARAILASSTDEHLPPSRGCMLTRRSTGEFVLYDYNRMLDDHIERVSAHVAMNDQPVWMFPDTEQALVFASDQPIVRQP